MSPAKRGFTLAELIVSLAILVILIGFLVPAVQSARERARRTQCRDHMKQIALALHSYHDAYLVFPPGWLAQTVSTTIISGPFFGLAPEYNTGVNISGAAWGAFLLPFVGQKTAYNQFDFNHPMTDATPDASGQSNVQAIQQSIALFRCPSDNSQGAAASFESSRGCGPGCTQTSQGGTAPPASIPKGYRLASTSNLQYPVAGDLGDRSVPAAISNYLGNSGAWMADGNVADIDLTIQGHRETPKPPPPDFGGVMFERSRVRLQDITDGASNTALIAEHTGATCFKNPNLQVSHGTACHAWWANADSFVGNKNMTTVASDVVFSSANGVNGSRNASVGAPGDVSSLHPGGADISFCDSSVKFLSSQMSPMVLQYMCIRNDDQKFIPEE